MADSSRFDTLVSTLADRITARMDSADSGDAWAMVGIRSRGDVLARRLVERIGPGRFAGRVGAVDITLYRDDLSEIGAQPVVRTTDIPFPLDGLDVVLVDDVLMTGRSVRAALQSLMDLGRPRRIWLAVLVDRGGRELPIAPDEVALDLTANSHGLAGQDRVEVRLTPTDPQDAILLMRPDTIKTVTADPSVSSQGGHAHE